MTQKYSTFRKLDSHKMKLAYILNLVDTIKGFGKIATFGLLLLASLNSFAQSPQISAGIDSTSIKIGEQIKYQISVETDSTALVVFPEGATFNPLEVVESLSTDTSRIENRFRLLKEYYLTQFDSGSYTIPQQRVLINERAFLTDSFQVEVADVVVDTTKQKMFPIKPAMEVPSGFEIPNWIWWILGILILAGLAFFFIRRKKKRDAAIKQLPPYERALFELEQLDKSHLLENRQTKEYYSKLTEAVRRYIEDEVHLRAMESTTSELIHFLELKKQTGELKLSEQTITDLQVILQRADLAKFANTKPDIITAKSDRSKIEHVIIDTKAAIPEPTEEELLKDEEYRQLQLKKRKKKKIITASLIGLLLVFIIGTILVNTKGYDYIVDFFGGNPTKELLDGEWIQSEYGDPSVSIITPRVLKRGEIDMPNEAKEMLVGNETFIDGMLEEELYVVLSTVNFEKDVKFELNTAVEGVYANLEKKGAKNIITKDEEYSTLEGVKGVKVFGTLEMEIPKKDRSINKKYIILNFAVNGGFQQITVIYNEQDTYADEIANRIINSVEFEKPTN
ncbi:LPXTG-motif cell wall-anchored protein [Gillisia mitskevichiae]|uniref:LPXTG-motif cell wall-anchored protein n=1 Tax=Gillisia mitskevichiae TaxID=270921 RepID=A0A495PWD0_9FLAO|nr:LPXTG cell wall anchor domain-containing protein [Gillisia mitskevichiae]RKS55464.1 LPXTG-motif cell wall-anchored protein [Gillisia mitskevichiae]